MIKNKKKRSLGLRFEGEANDGLIGHYGFLLYRVVLPDVVHEWNDQ